MSSKTLNYSLHKIDLTDAPPDITVLNDNWDIIDEHLGSGGGGNNVVVSATSTDGVSYTATIDKLTELYTGLTITIVPDKTSTTVNPTLNVNSLGAKNIKRRLSNIYTSVQSGYSASWISINNPFQLIYDGTQWIVNGVSKPSASDLYGAIPIEKGGTNATTAAEALNNLGGVAKAGDTMTGALIAQNNTNYTTKQVRNVFIVADGNNLPSGASGDLCVLY